ncbi:MAG TPA: hypothetical protein ENG65_00160 [Candidatus Bathyarchaeota archaeon]|nr:hypothetical protein [Candidatus Bathyarchaeota archaeon]
MGIYCEDSKDIYIIVPLRDAKSYPSRPYVDLLLPIGRFAGECYFWIYTEAKHPIIEFWNERLLPRKVADEDGRRWLFMGKKVLKLDLASPPILRFYDLTDPASDICLVTSNKSFIPHGGFADVERQILGYNRESPGMSQIIPNVATVGRPMNFRLIFTAGAALIRRGGRIRLTIPEGLL